MKYKIKYYSFRSQQYLLPSKQKGATLYLAIIFLALMTVISLTAIKISMSDVLVSGNNQQVMELFQKTDREVNNHATGKRLINLLLDEPSTQNIQVPWAFEYPVQTDTHIKQKITNRAFEYPCEDQDGLATSQGPDNICQLFDFEINTSIPASSARERHILGKGKRFPSGSKNNYNN